MDRQQTSSSKGVVGAGYHVEEQDDFDDEDEGSSDLDEDEEEEEVSESSEEEEAVVEENPRARKVAKGSRQSKVLNPLMMIDAQYGQGSKKSLFGMSGEEIYQQPAKTRRGKKVKKRGRPSGARAIPKDIQKLHGLANEHFLNEDYDKAIKVCDEMVKRSPSLPGSYHMLASIWFTKGVKEKELFALQWACSLDKNASLENYRRMGELGLELGRDPKVLSLSEQYGSDVEEEEEREDGESQKKDVSQLTDTQDTVVSEGYSKARRHEFLHIARKAYTKIMGRKFSMDMALKKGETLELLHDYKRAGYLYKKLLKRCLDKKKINLVLVHRLARVYRLRGEDFKCESLLEKYVNSVLFPSEDLLFSILQHAEQARKEREELKLSIKRRQDALGKRKAMKAQKKTSVQETMQGMALEERVFRAHETGPEEEKLELEDEESSEEDALEEEANAIAEDHVIAEEKEQLAAGINILSVLVEMYLSTDEFEARHERAQEYLNRFLEFREKGICSNTEKNQWQFWDQIQPQIPLDITMMLLLVSVYLGDYARAYEVARSISNIQLEASESRALNLYFRTACAWNDKVKHVAALDILERLMEVGVPSVTFRVNVLLTAVYSCERISHFGKPERAALTAPVKAIKFLQEAIEIIEPFLSDEKKMKTYNDAWTTSLVKLKRLYESRDRLPEAEALMKKYPSGFGPRERPEQRKVKAGKATDGATSADVSELRQSLGLPPAPPTLLGSSFQKDTALRNVRAKKYRKTGKSKPKKRNYPDATDAVLSALLEIHQKFVENKYNLVVMQSLPYIQGLFPKDSMFNYFIQRLYDGKYSVRAVEETLRKVSNSATLQFVEELCLSLIEIKKAHFAAEFLYTIQPWTQLTVQGTHNKKRVTLLLTKICLQVEDYNMLFKQLIMILRTRREVEVTLLEANADGDDRCWGDESSTLWELLNATLISIKIQGKTSLDDMKVIHRRIERAAGPLDGALSYGHQIMLANQFILNRNYVKALSHYFVARKLSPESPLMPLCIATCYLRIAHSRSALDKFPILVKVLAHLQEYERLRKELASDDTQVGSFDAETQYNLGRFAHEIGLPLLAEACYRRVLEMEDVSVQDKREAAHNLVVYYRSINNLESAVAVTRKYLTI